ncbi:MAG: 23S rRNA (pseudouridine(1915)-N(3))-methyltransferase RlmH [Verrucomicrobiota bacterium]
MRLHVISVGKPKLLFAKEGWREYERRLRSSCHFEFSHVKVGPTQDREGERVLERAGNAWCVVCDERGTSVTSRELAGKLQQWKELALSEVAILIGGADGHAEAVKDRADWTWSLGPLTLQHELALIVVLEQLYRAQTILAGSPYHRD